MIVSSPRASVIMPVLNADDCIEESIQSVLSQSFSDFEFIIVDAGSSDDTISRIKSFKDERIRCLRFNNNTGLIAAANLALAEVDSPLIIRVNPGHLSSADRFLRQVAFMDQNPECGVCGTAVNENGEICLNPLDHDSILARMVFENPITDGTSIIRSALMHEQGFRYRDLFHGMAEYDLWFRLKNVCRFANLPEPLVSVIGKKNNNHNHSHKRETATLFHVESLNELGLRPDEKELKYHTDLAIPGSIEKVSKPKKYKKWLDKLKTTNHIVYRFPRKAFDQEIEYRWQMLFRHIHHRDIKKASDWLRIEGKSEWHILKWRIDKWLGKA